MSTRRHFRRLFFGWIAVGALLFAIAELVLVGFPGICGFTGVLLGSFADHHGTFGFGCFYVALFALPVCLLSFVLWLVLTMLPAAAVDRPLSNP